MSAIVGGILAQEVIKTISNRDAPHKNFFFYNPIESSGVVEMIGYWETADFELYHVRIVFFDSYEW